MNKLSSPNHIKFNISPHPPHLSWQWTSCQGSIPTAAPLIFWGHQQGRAWPDALGQGGCCEEPRACSYCNEGWSCRFRSQRAGLCQQPQGHWRGSKILKPLMCSFVSAFNPKSFSGCLLHSGSEGRGLYWDKIWHVIFPFQKVWGNVIYGFFPDTRSLPDHFCHSPFSPYGYVWQCPIVSWLHHASAIQIIGSSVPGKLVFDFRLCVMVHGYLQEFYLYLHTSVYLVFLFDIIIFIQLSPYELIHVTFSLVILWALEGYFCIPLSVIVTAFILGCYPLKNAATFECQTDVLIEP